MRVIIMGLMVGTIMLGSGCSLFVNMPAFIQQSAPVYRDEYVNKGLVRQVCGGRAVVVNESSVRIQTWQDNYSSNNRDIVADGIPYEHIVVEGYDHYGQLAGRTEKTFLCTKRETPERWVITNQKLWWQQE